MLDTFSSSDRVFLVDQLTGWFRETKRNLPWRQTYDPYHVWISEIMLQQTQMERGVQYFLRWIERFPAVKLDIRGFIKINDQTYISLEYGKSDAELDIEIKGGLLDVEVISLTD